MKKVLIFLVVLVVLVASFIVVFKKISDETLIRITKTDSLNSILNEPSKIIFVTNNGIYASDKDENRTERVAVINSKFDIRIYGISPDAKWIILNPSPVDFGPKAKQYLYALNIETLKLVKIEEDYWEGGFKISFEMGDDKLLYGFQGVNAPFISLSCFDLNNGKMDYLLDSSKNKEEKAFYYAISPDKKYIAYAGGNVESFPDNRTGLYLKNLETGELKLLAKPSNLNQNFGEDYISSVEFVNNSSEILYSRTTWSKNGKETDKWFVVDLEGNSKEISAEEASKLYENREGLSGTKLKKLLNKNLYINAVLDKCKKIVFSTLENEEKLFICNDDLSNIVFTGITNPNFMHFSPNSCKFTCEVLLHNDASIAPTSIWYLIDATTNKKVNLNELFKVEVKDAIYIGE